MGSSAHPPGGPACRARPDLSPRNHSPPDGDAKVPPAGRDLPSGPFGRLCIIGETQDPHPGGFRPCSTASLIWASPSTTSSSNPGTPRSSPKRSEEHTSELQSLRHLV